MTPGTSFRAPSQALLRFLRAQSRSLALGGPGPAAVSGAKSAHSRTAFRREFGCVADSKRRSAGAHGNVWAGSCPRTLLTQSTHATETPLAQPRQASRQLSTSSARRSSQKAVDGLDSGWIERVLGPKRRPPPAPLSPQEEEELDAREEEDSIFPRRSSKSKSALDPRLRCTEVDGNGKVIMVDGEVKKSELIARYGLLPRDLRKIDSSNLPHILVRNTAILLNLLHLKVLIKHDRVLLFDVYGSKTSYPQSAFMYDLEGKLQQKQDSGLPYEFRALEAVLISVTSQLETDLDNVRDPVLRVLSELEDDINRDKLRMLLVLSKKLSTFEQKARLVRDAIEELLEANDDLAAMYLTEKTHDLYRQADDHTEVELLLESYHKICDEVAQEASNLVSSIRNTEEIIRAILDANRNSLMLLDLKFSVGTLGLATGTFLAGLYGMNLENFIEKTNWGFGAVTSVSAFFSILICWYGLTKLRKVQRVSMSGGGGMQNLRGSHWFRDDGDLLLLDPNNRERLRRLRLTQQASKQKKPYLGLIVFKK